MDLRVKLKISTTHGCFILWKLQVSHPKNFPSSSTESSLLLLRRAAKVAIKSRFWCHIYIISVLKTKKYILYKYIIYIHVLCFLLQSFLFSGIRTTPQTTSIIRGVLFFLCWKSFRKIEKRLRISWINLETMISLGSFCWKPIQVGKKIPNDKTVGVIAVPAHDKLFCIFLGGWFLLFQPQIHKLVVIAFLLLWDCPPTHWLGVFQPVLLGIFGNLQRFLLKSTTF